MPPWWLHQGPPFHWRRYAGSAHHAITDISSWLEAFAQFAAVRKAAGVTEEHIWQPVEDPQYVVVDLKFETTTAAAAFRSFLYERVWSAEPSVMVGSPSAVVLTEAEV